MKFYLVTVKIDFDSLRAGALEQDMAQQKTYHHGDLRQALLHAALEILEESGLAGLSLRKAAARVGVSHAAPEHHFPSLKHVLNAMATEGFRLFEAAMLDEMAASGKAPAEQLRAASRGYLAFATGRPHLFRLMFTVNLLDWSDMALSEAGLRARLVLSDICRPVAMHLKLDTPDGRAAVEKLVWSQIHGYAHLVIDGKFTLEGAPDCEGPIPPLDLAGLLLRD